MKAIRPSLDFRLMDLIQVPVHNRTQSTSHFEKRGGIERWLLKTSSYFESAIDEQQRIRVEPAAEAS